MPMREWLAGVLERVGLRGLRHQVEIQRAVEKALTGWNVPLPAPLAPATMAWLEDL